MQENVTFVRNALKIRINVLGITIISLELPWSITKLTKFTILHQSIESENPMYYSRSPII